jgi:hypothetical protein
MSRKDYELIARVIREFPIPRAEKAPLANEFARELGLANANFNRHRFMAACLGER